MIAGVLLFYLIACFGANSLNAKSDDCSVCGKGPPRFPVCKMVKGGLPIPNTKSFPWLVKLGYHYTTRHCVGIILDEYFILTAAHCLKDKPDKWNKRMNVFFQTESRTRFSKAAAIENMVVHPNYELMESNTTSVLFAMYDIGLIKLKKKIKCNKYKRSICLPKSDYSVPTNRMFYIAGWGAQGSFIQGDQCTHRKICKMDVPESEILQYGTLASVPFKTCLKRVPETTVLKDHMLCLGDTGQTVCPGDSGGPLLGKINNKYTVFGVASSETAPNSKVEDPVLYTNVAFFVIWIEDAKRQLLKQSSYSKRLKCGRKCAIERCEGRNKIKRCSRKKKKIKVQYDKK